jgi:hypothetical protein
VSDYRSRHGDPDITRYRHACLLCGLRLILNSGVVRKHFLAKHALELEAYMQRFRDQLLKEKRERPVMPTHHTLGVCTYLQTVLWIRDPVPF